MPKVKLGLPRRPPRPGGKSRASTSRASGRSLTLPDRPPVLPDPAAKPPAPTAPPIPVPLADAPWPLGPDGGKIEQAVAFINERALRISGALLEIGEFLLREFFDGDIDLVANRDPGKMQSFRILAERDDLIVGFVTLWRSVRLAVQEQRFRTVSPAKQLTPPTRSSCYPSPMPP